MSQYALSQYPLSHFDVYWLVLIKTGCPPTQNHFVFPGSAVLCIFAHYKTFRKLEILEFWKNLTIFSKKNFQYQKKLKNQVLKKPKCYNISFFKNDKRKTYKSYSRLTMVLVNQPVTVTPTVSQFRQKTFFVFHPSQKFYPCRILRGINFYEI